MRLLAVVLALAVAGPSAPEVEALLAEAKEAFGAEDFDKASDALARAYALDPRPKILYGQAQAERLAGRCANASPLYIAFLKTEPEPRAARGAEWGLSWCLANRSLEAGACEQAQVEIEELRPKVDQPNRASELRELEQGLEACRNPKPAAEPESEPPPPVVKPPEPELRDRARVDPWGLALGSLSVLSAGGAVGLFLAGNAQIDAVSLEGTHSRARARHVQGRTMQGAAIGAAAAAGAFAIGAVVHWVVWRKRLSRTSTARR